MTKIEPIGIGGLHRGLTIPEIYIENTKLHDEVNGLRKQRRKAREKNKQLQSNWNSLKEWLEKQKHDAEICKEWNSKNNFNDIDYERDIKRFDFVLDKMNELEGKDNNE